MVMVCVPVVLAACGSTPTASGSTSTAASPEATPAASPAPVAAVVKAGTATVSGAATMVLTDAQGLSLYYRAQDGPTTISCVAACAANWPPILLPIGTPTASPGVPGALTVFAGPNGRQVLYNGHPLYLWVKDTAPGQATGQNIGGFKVVTPDIAVAG
jgi:predicted lipoprotein with Yx(FWY)xxD motif